MLNYLFVILFACAIRSLINPASTAPDYIWSMLFACISLRFFDYLSQRQKMKKDKMKKEELLKQIEEEAEIIESPFSIEFHMLLTRNGYKCIKERGVNQVVTSAVYKKFRRNV